MKIIRVLNFKSLDAKKQDKRNKPEDFTTRFKTQLVLDDNTNYYLALEQLSMSASWHNITPKYNNDKIKYSKDNGVSYEEITFPSGIYDYEDINNYIHSLIGKTRNKYGINILFNITTYKVHITLEPGYHLDLREGNFHILLGFDKALLKTNVVSPHFPNISNSIDNLYICCSLISDSIVSGSASNILYSFPTNTKTRSLPFEIRPYNYLPQLINSKRIDNVRFYVVDDDGRIVDLNKIDISVTVVIGVID